jgi:hypothetical protein
MSRKSKQKSRHYESLDKPFFAFPVDSIKSKKLNSVSPQARWLFTVLMTKFNRRKDKIKKYFPFPYVEIHKITGYNPRRISSCIDELETNDIIEIERGGKNNPNKYRPMPEYVS